MQRNIKFTEKIIPELLNIYCLDEEVVCEQLLDMHFFAPHYSEEEILVEEISIRIISLRNLQSPVKCSELYQQQI